MLKKGDIVRFISKKSPSGSVYQSYGEHYTVNKEYKVEEDEYIASSGQDSVNVWTDTPDGVNGPDRLYIAPDMFIKVECDMF